eukprot:GFUD01070535.1.p1 GENE.GFUD01070535.1~~GFUD01070535.1.p1  ORF type:complete len:1158 (+),score=343.89 GFUD01070535.1:243-3716(+)
MMQPPQQPGWQGQPRPMGPPGTMGPRPGGPPMPGQLNNQMSNMNLGPMKPMGPPGGPMQRPMGPPGGPMGPGPIGPPGQMGGPRPMGHPGQMGPGAPLGPPQSNGPRPLGPPGGPPGPVNGLAPQMNNGVNGHNGRVSPNTAPLKPPVMGQPSSSFPPSSQPGPGPHPSAQGQPGPPRPGMQPPVAGLPPNSMAGMPPSSIGSMPPNSMGGMPPMPPSSAGGMPPSSMGGMPPSSMAGMPPSSIGGPQPPNSMGGMPPRPSMGMPPQPGMGMAPRPSMGMPPQPSLGMPPQPGMGMPPQPGMGMPPQPSMGMPPQPGMGMPPQPGMGMPPQPGMGMPPQPGMGMPQQPGMGVGGQPGGGYPSAGGYPGAGAMNQPQRKALDPDSMPNPIQVMADDKATHSTGEFVTNEKGKVPPLVTTHFLTRDQGNSGPRMMRSTMYSVPDNPDMKKQTGVPLGLVMSPLAEAAPGEYPPPVVNLGDLGPVRCLRCKAYMSPFMTFTDGGKRFQCSFCKATTEVPQEYFQHLDHTGQRMDKYERPELCLGTYDIVATKDYCRDSKPPNPPGILFAIDVSYPMVKEGIVHLICQNMKDILKNLPIDHAAGITETKMKVGFMTYDSKINFYNCNSLLAQPQQMTVGDVEDMFVPLAEGLMVDLDKSEAVIDSLLQSIPAMFAETRETETVLGPVIQAGKEAFKAAGMAGKLVVFHHNLPVAGAPGQLKNRDDRKCLGTEKEKTVLSPQTKFYNDLGQECVGVGCSVDLFLFNNAYIDIATLSQVCRLTGGQLYKYTYFQADLDGERFISDLTHNISRPVVFDAIMRVRTSTGVRPIDFFGSFYMANTTDMELASVNSDMALACEIKHDDKLTDEDGVYIQAALLYTSVSGQRRLRICNLALATCDNMGELYRNCDLDTVVNFLAKQNISRLMETSPKQVKEGLMSQCATILACYRKNCASPSSAGQLILPECMKLLPLYTNCLIKSDALSGGSDLGCDDRAFHMSCVSNMDVASSVVYFYPRLIPLHNISTEETGVPDQVRCTIEKVRDDGVYLLENGIHVLLFVGLATDPAWIQDVFGVATAAQIDIDKTKLVERDNPMSRRVCEIYRAVTEARARTMKLTIVRQRDKLEIVFKHFLCEDRSTASDSHFSYVDFLCHMHKEIRAMLS